MLKVDQFISHFFVVAAVSLSDQKIPYQNTHSNQEENWANDESEYRLERTCYARTSTVKNNLYILHIVTFSIDRIDFDTI